MTETTTTPDVAPTPAKKSFVSTWLTPILALVAAVGLGLFGGLMIGQNTASAENASVTGRPDVANLPTDGVAGADGPAGGFAAGGNAAFGGGTSGTVTGIDGDVVTIELADGSVVTITTSADTTVTTTSDATVSDLADGDTVTVIGETDDDGNVASATSISEGATFGGFGGTRGEAPAGQ